MTVPLSSNDGLLESVQSGQTANQLPSGDGQGEQEGGPGGTTEYTRVPKGETWCEVAKAEADGKWYWVLWGGHGRAMATCSVGYKNREDCVTAFKAVGQAAADESTKIGVAYIPRKRAR